MQEEASYVNVGSIKRTHTIPGVWVPASPGPRAEHPGRRVIKTQAWMLSVSACLERVSDKQSSGVVSESLLNALVTKFHISIMCIVINLLWGVVFIYIYICICLII